MPVTIRLAAGVGRAATSVTQDDDAKRIRTA